MAAAALFIGMVVLSSLLVSLAFLYLWRKRLRSLLHVALAAGLANAALWTGILLLYGGAPDKGGNFLLTAFIYFDALALISLTAALMGVSLLWCCVPRTRTRSKAP